MTLLRYDTTVGTLLLSRRGGVEEEEEEEEVFEEDWSLLRGSTPPPSFWWFWCPQSAAGSVSQLLPTVRRSDGRLGYVASKVSWNCLARVPPGSINVVLYFWSR